MENSSQIRPRVRDAYSAAGRRPEDGHPFPIGREFAESLGYPDEVLSALPPACVEAFSGVSNVTVFAEIPKGAMVLDLGCGAGLDSLIAARRTGPGGTVIGVDFSVPMLARARKSATDADLRNVVFCHADAESLPVRDESIAIALVNGIFNLNPAREAIFKELGRVMQYGGVVYSAELILHEGHLPKEEQSEANWFA